MNGVIISMAIAFVMLGIAGVTVNKNSLGWQVVRCLFAVMVIGSAYIWCLFDSEVHDHPFGKYMMILFIIVLPIAIAIYFYRGRGFRQGSIVLMKAIGLVVLSLILGAVSGVTTSRILGIAIK